MNLKIKPFKKLTLDELYDILKLRDEVFVVEQHCFYQDCDDIDKEAHHLFYEDNSKIISYLRIYKKYASKDEVSIGRVAVKQEFRGKGLAKELMNEAIKFIENNLNINNIEISAQSYLIDFYKNLGFIVISEEYLDAGIPHVDMLYRYED